MNLRLNKKLIDNSLNCKTCEAVFKFIVSEFKSDLADVITPLVCDNNNFVVCEIDNDNIILNYAKTPNEVMFLLFKYNILEKTKEFENLDFSKLFLMHLSSLSNSKLKIRE